MYVAKRNPVFSHFQGKINEDLVLLACKDTTQLRCYHEIMSRSVNICYHAHNIMQLKHAEVTILNNKSNLEVISLTLGGSLTS